MAKEVKKKKDEKVDIITLTRNHLSIRSKRIIDIIDNFYEIKVMRRSTGVIAFVLFLYDNLDLFPKGEVTYSKVKELLGDGFIQTAWRYYKDKLIELGILKKVKDNGVYKIDRERLLSYIRFLNGLVDLVNVVYG